MSLKSAKNAQAMKTSIMTLLKIASKQIPLTKDQKNLLPSYIDISMVETFGEAMDDMLKQIESNLDCNDFFSTFQKAFQENDLALMAFSNKKLFTGINLLATNGDASSEANPKQIKKALMTCVGLFSAALKMVLMIFSNDVCLQGTMKHLCTGTKFPWNRSEMLLLTKHVVTMLGFMKLQQ